MKKFTTLIAAATVAVIGFAGSAYAGEATGLRDARDATLKFGADTHLGRQGNGGGPAEWEWVIGSGGGGVNVLGISATGLLYAYEQLSDPSYLDGAILAGDTLVARYDAVTTRPYSQDVEFLARLSQLTGNETYLDKAVGYYGRIVVDFPTAGELVDRYIGARRSLAGWDLASQIRAAIATGHVEYAEGIADNLIANRVGWETIHYCCGWDATTLSYGSLVWALGELGNKNFRDFAKEIAAALLASQGGDGSWDEGDYQTTAYVLLGLDTLPRRPNVQISITGGVKSLILSQDEQGGWVYSSGSEYGEINSEVLMALGAARVDNGKHEGFTDPQPDNGNDQHIAEPIL